MSRTPLHPTREQIELPMVLDCLSDPIRLAIVYQLAQQERVSSELCCGDFSGLSGKSNLAYHFAKLRECGLMLTRVAGTNRFMRSAAKIWTHAFRGCSMLSSAPQPRMPTGYSCCPSAKRLKWIEVCEFSRICFGRSVEACPSSPFGLRRGSLRTIRLA